MYSNLAINTPSSTSSYRPGKRTIDLLSGDSYLKVRKIARVNDLDRAINQFHTTDFGDDRELAGKMLIDELSLNFSRNIRARIEMPYLEGLSHLEPLDRVPMTPPRQQTPIQEEVVSPITPSLSLESLSSVGNPMDVAELGETLNFEDNDSQRTLLDYAESTTSTLTHTDNELEIPWRRNRRVNNLVAQMEDDVVDLTLERPDVIDLTESDDDETIIDDEDYEPTIIDSQEDMQEQLRCCGQRCRFINGLWICTVSHKSIMRCEDITPTY